MLAAAATMRDGRDEREEEKKKKVVMSSKCTSPRARGGVRGDKNSAALQVKERLKKLPHLSLERQRKELEKLETFVSKHVGSDDVLTRGRVANAWCMLLSSQGETRQACGIVHEIRDRVLKRLQRSQERGGRNEFLIDKLFVDLTLNLCGSYASMRKFDVALKHCTEAIETVLRRVTTYPFASKSMQRTSAQQLAIAQYNLGTLLENLQQPELARQAYTFSQSVGEHAACFDIATISRNAREDLETSQ